MDTYEKKYKNLLERAIKRRDENCDGCKICLESLFDELRVLEDERIIKAQLDYWRSVGGKEWHGVPVQEVIAWLEKQVGCELDCPQNHQDSSHPNGCIVLEDFNGGEGFYKVHLDYLNKKQVEEVEEMIRAWNTELKTPNENIKACIGMALTDVPETRFKSYGVSLKECLDWFEKQVKPKWTDEDEAHLHSVTTHLEQWIECHPNTCGADIQGENLAWLESLKQRLQ